MRELPHEVSTVRQTRACEGEGLSQVRHQGLEGTRITLVAELLGGAKPLPRHEVRSLFESRGRYGVKSRSGMERGAPLTAEDMPAGTKIQLTREELIDIIDEALRARGVLT